MAENKTKSLSGYLLGLELIVFVTSLVLLESIFLLFRIGIHPIGFLGAIFITTAWLFWCNEENTYQYVFLYILIGILLLFFIVLINLCLYDYSYDGKAIHQIAMANLKDGWNPVYESADTFYERFPELNQLYSSPAIWIDHYAKASWIFGAVFYQLTGSVEAGKSLNLLFCIAFFLIIADSLKKFGLKKRQTYLIAFLCSFNPVSISEMFSSYLDGSLGISLFLIILSLIESENPYYQRNRKHLATSLTCGILICTNLKYTGFAYAAVFCFSFYIFHLITVFIKNPKNFGITWAKITGYYCIIVSIAILVIGSNSYVRNQLDHHHIFYPLMGPNKIVFSEGRPENFEEMNFYKQFFLMLFSKCENLLKEDVTLKIPFTFSWDEWRVTTCDTRRSGFGPWFSGIFLISLGIIVWELKDSWKTNPWKRNLLLEIMLPSLLLIGIVEHSWVARYSPYLYLIPILSLIMLFKRMNKTQEKNSRHFLYLILPVCMTINMLAFGPVLAKILVRNYQFHKAFAEMKKSPMVLCHLSEKNHGGTVYNLRDQGIHYLFTLEEISDCMSLPELHLDYRILEDEM